MAFNSENDPDLMISIDAWGKNFSSDRDDPSIHESKGSRIISTHSYVTRCTINDDKDDDDDVQDIEDSHDNNVECEPSPWEKKCRRKFRQYVQVSKMAACIARDAIFRGVGLDEVYRLIAERFQYEAKAYSASVRAKRKKDGEKQNGIATRKLVIYGYTSAFETGCYGANIFRGGQFMVTSLLYTTKSTRVSGYRSVWHGIC